MMFFFLKHKTADERRISDGSSDVCSSDLVASTLEERGGRLTGRYANDVTGRKREAIEARCGSEALTGRWIAISDNLSDAALLTDATQGYAVIRKPAHRERWAGFRGEIVEACR